VIAIPAVDLREGACVQLVGGSFAREAVRLDNPVEVARAWERCGFRRLHVVDLDAATGRGSNLPLVRSLIDDCGIPSQVGGGVRSGALAAELLDAGALRVIVGTRAIEDPEWLAELAARHPGEIIVACDVRGRRVTTRGWARTLALDILDVLAELNPLPLGGLLVTAVHCEGQLQGTDLPLMEDVDFIRRLRRRGRLLHSDVPALTSARRWERDGWLTRSAENVALIVLFLAGWSPATLARRYYRRTGSP